MHDATVNERMRRYRARLKELGVKRICDDALTYEPARSRPRQTHPFGYKTNAQIIAESEERERRRAATEVKQRPANPVFLLAIELLEDAP